MPDQPNQQNRKLTEWFSKLKEGHFADYPGLEKVTSYETFKSFQAELREKGLKIPTEVVWRDIENANRHGQTLGEKLPDTNLPEDNKKKQSGTHKSFAPYTKQKQVAQASPGTDQDPEIVSMRKHAQEIAAKAFWSQDERKKLGITGPGLISPNREEIARAANITTAVEFAQAHPEKLTEYAKSDPTLARAQNILASTQEELQKDDLLTGQVREGKQQALIRQKINEDINKALEQNEAQEERQDQNEQNQQIQQLRQAQQQASRAEQTPSQQQFTRRAPPTQSFQRTSPTQRVSRPLMRGGQAAGRAAARTAGRLGGAVAKTGAKIAARAALMEPHVLLVLAIVAAIILIIFLAVLIIILLFGGGIDEIPTGTIPVVITKSGPPQVDNGADILYDITVSYAGSATDIIVTDPIPENADFVSASGVFTNVGNVITWKVSENSGGAGPSGSPVPSSAPSGSPAPPGTLTNPSATFTLTLKPKAGVVDTYIVNQSFAQVLGGGGGGGGGDGSGVPPNQDTCNGVYGSGAKNINDGGQHNGDNFGDPTCELAVSYPSDGGPPTLFVDLLNQLDPQNASIWTQIAACEAPGYDPNNVTDFGGTSKPWGLFQMGASGHSEGGTWVDVPYQTGDGQNGPYDRGDVYWRDQVSNAINYNKQLGIKWSYWECADQCHPLDLWYNAQGSCVTP